MTDKNQDKKLEIEDEEESFVDNEDYSWEYYSAGKLVDYDEYAKTAHTSYYTV